MAGIKFTKGSGLNDSIYGKSQEPIFAMVEQAVEAFEEKSIVKEIFTMESSKNFAEKLTSETSLGGFEPVGESGAYPTSSFQEGYSKVIEPETWKNSFSVSQEMIEDANMGKVKKPARSFALSWGRTREDFGAKLLMAGFSGSMTVGAKSFAATTADGANLFSTAHTSKTGGAANQSNFFNADISYDTICRMEENMQNFTDDDGNILNVMPDTIIVPNHAYIKDIVFNAVGIEQKPGDANHTYNMQYGKWNIIVWPYLNPYVSALTGLTAGKDPIIMMDSSFNEAFYGAVWFERVKLAIKSYVDENTDDNVWKGRARFNAGFNNWRAFAACYPGATATALTSL